VVRQATPTPAPVPEVRQTTLDFVGLVGPDKREKGWSQCWGYGKNNPAHWSTALQACGDYENVVFAGERCDGTWVEWQIDLKAPLKKYMQGGGRSSPQKNIDTENKFNMEWSNDWWVLTKGGWDDGPAGTARCWEPHMSGSTGDNDGHILDQACRGNQDSVQQRHCDNDRYYVYVNHNKAKTSTRDRFNLGFVGAQGPDKTDMGMTQCWGYSKDSPAHWSTAMSACGDKKKVVFAGYRCDGTWVEFNMELDTPLKNYMQGGGLSSPQKNIDTENKFNMEWSNDWWVLTKGGWDDGPADTARCWEPHMSGSTGDDHGHILDQACRGNQDSVQQRHCDDDQYFVYFKDE
jgi:hypothetical protein